MSAKLCIIFSVVIYYSARVKCVNTDSYGTEPNIGSALLQLGKKMKHPLLQLLAKAFDSLEYRIEKLEKFSQDINIKSQMTETDGRGASFDTAIKESELRLKKLITENIDTLSKKICSTTTCTGWFEWNECDSKNNSNNGLQNSITEYVKTVYFCPEAGERKCKICADDYSQDSSQSGGRCKDLRPELAVSPMKAEEPEGSTVVYQCQVKSGEGPLNVVWSRQDKRQLPDRATVSPKYSLTIRNLKRDDTGRYSCSATNRYGATRQEVELIVIADERPEITIIVRQTKYVSIVGETARLECYTEDETGRVTLFWSRSSGLPYGSSQDNGILTIPNVQPSYAGNYVCTGTDRESRRVGTAVAVLGVQIEEESTLLS
ncbi:basement membrane-specific heparan sulfate proteoglycan core protein-like [Ruditapes philippinarum]|uniref:basement membrane-specific heparan sulfate proteoglycan core protein-like n=1 Tax=Ruditapes philippinarum TaxID=129788 RepID=UPI00295C051C|nr:basement membrane-specific heparan sulfate proteoglycan core protein-like [Ruditapes philippinarum]